MTLRIQNHGGRNRECFPLATNYHSFTDEKLWAAALGNGKLSGVQNMPPAPNTGDAFYVEMEVWRQNPEYKVSSKQELVVGEAKQNQSYLDASIDRLISMNHLQGIS